MALTLVTSDLIHGLDYSKLTGTITTWNQNTTGSAATLTTARNIGGVSFNGSAAINLPGVNTAGNQNTSGVAATATLLATARNINGVPFNGSTNITIADATKLPLVGGTLTGALVGTSATFNTGASRGIVLDNDSVDTPYNVISLNGTNVKGSYSGIAGGGTGNDNLYLNSADGVIVQTGSSFTPKLTILTGGNVGVGTAVPQYPLQVKSGTNINFAIAVGVADNTAVRLNAVNDAVTANIPMEFYATKFNFNNGNVGIGTTSPSADLEIKGSNTYNKIRSYFSGNYTSGFQFSDFNGGIWYDAGADDLFINGGHANSQLIFNAGGSEKMRIRSGGRTEITTSSNDDTLVLNNTGTYAGSVAFNQRASDGTLSNAGYVGSIRAFEGSNTADNGVGLFSRTRMSFYINSATPRLTISSGGNLIISKSDTGYNNEALQIINSGNHEAAIRYDTNHTANKGFTVGAAITVADAFEITRVASSGVATPYLVVGSSWTHNLDAYEEGTWGVTLPNSSGASITTYRARYTIIGNVCHFQLYVIMGSIPSNGNPFQISLPITPDSTSNDYTGVSMGYCNNFNTNSWLPITHEGAAYIYFHRNDGNSAVITNAQASGLPQIILSGHYYV